MPRAKEIHLKSKKTYASFLMLERKTVREPKSMPFGLYQLLVKQEHQNRGGEEMLCRLQGTLSLVRTGVHYDVMWTALTSQGCDQICRHTTSNHDSELRLWTVIRLLWNVFNVYKQNCSKSFWNTFREASRLSASQTKTGPRIHFPPSAVSSRLMLRLLKRRQGRLRWMGQ